MIGFLRGRLAAKEPPRLTVDVGGVGYEVEAPMSTFFQLPDIGSDVQLCTHLVIREDQHTLYGFASEDERRLFRDLLRVTGVGARMALTILSGSTVEGFMRCVQSGDAAALVRLPGIGRKTADRLIVELRDRVEERLKAAPASGGGPRRSAPRTEAHDALVALGYGAAEARRMLDRVPETIDSTEEILRQVLRAAAG